jgi:lysophospholipase L1-like esterase
LGKQFEIIEEGLNGRTTVLDDSENEGKNGETYLKPCLQSHYPLDIVILMLGTNDLKERFKKTPEQIAQGVQVLLSIIHNAEYNYNKKPKVIFLAPPYVDESVEGVQEKYRSAEEKSKVLASFYKKVADTYRCEFIDIAQYVSPSKIDGYHLDPEAHKKIAQVLEEKIREIQH